MPTARLLLQPPTSVFQVYPVSLSPHRALPPPPSSLRHGQHGLFLPVSLLVLVVVAYCTRNPSALSRQVFSPIFFTACAVQLVAAVCTTFRLWSCMPPCRTCKCSFCASLSASRAVPLPLLDRLLLHPIGHHFFESLCSPSASKSGPGRELEGLFLVFDLARSY